MEPRHIIVTCHGPTSQQISPPSHQPTVEVSVGLLLEQRARPKVDELEVAGDEVHQDVLVLDVAVDDALVVARHHRLHDLPEEVARQTLLQTPAVRDHIKQVFRLLGALQHEDEAVRALVEVHQLDDPLHALHGQQQLQLHGHLLAAVGGPLGHLVPGHVLDGHVGAVTCPPARVHRAKAALAEDLAHAVGALEGDPGLGPGLGAGHLLAAGGLDSGDRVTGGGCAHCSWSPWFLCSPSVRRGASHVSASLRVPAPTAGAAQVPPRHAAPAAAPRRRRKHAAAAPLLGPNVIRWHIFKLDRNIAGPRQDMATINGYGDYIGATEAIMVSPHHGCKL